MSRGFFLVLEGGEGAGKSTQARLLGEWLTGLGLPHVLAREPGGTPVGEAIRRVVLDKGDLTMPPETELFLMLGARAAFVRDVVKPALARGEVVIADRFDFSTFAYQSFDLHRRHSLLHAALNIGANLVVCIGGFLLGRWGGGLLV